MILLKLAWKSLRNRAVASFLTVLSIALSVFLLLTVERARRATEESFTQSVSQVDLIVGARSGPVQLVLFTVFNIGNPTHNISFETYEKWRKHPAVEWTIPYSLGDGHRGFRVVGTTEDFFEHYRFRGDQRPEFASGKSFKNLFDIVVGSDVAKKLGYKLSDKVVVAHGVTRHEGVLHHNDNPFEIVGVLNPTGTPIDQSVYIPLEAMEALHEEGDGHDHSGHEHHIDKISAFFIRTKNRIETLQLQRDINENKSEPLLAIIPGVTLAELWQSLSYAEKALKFISLMVVLVGFFAMLIALLTTLNERRREMAVLRSLGASPHHIFVLLVFESFLLSLSGIFFGFVITLFLQKILGAWISQQTGLYLTELTLARIELVYLLLILVAGTIFGCIPAIKAFNRSLKDGLSVRL
jgi:putative ABC transport system permease protein